MELTNEINTLGDTRVGNAKELLKKLIDVTNCSECENNNKKNINEEAILLNTLLLEENLLRSKGEEFQKEQKQIDELCEARRIIENTDPGKLETIIKNEKLADDDYKIKEALDILKKGELLPNILSYSDEKEKKYAILNALRDHIENENNKMVRKLDILNQEYRKLLLLHETFSACHNKETQIKRSMCQGIRGQ